MAATKKNKEVRVILKQLKQSFVKLGKSLLAKAPKGKGKVGEKLRMRLLRMCKMWRRIFNPLDSLYING